MFDVGFLSSRLYVRLWVHIRSACFFFLTWVARGRRAFCFGVSLTLPYDDVRMLCLDKP